MTRCGATLPVIAQSPASDFERRLFQHLNDSFDFFVVESYNFGCLFALYRSDPRELTSHADYLVVTSGTQKIYTANRLATILKKQVVYADEGPLQQVRLTVVERVTSADED